MSKVVYTGTLKPYSTGGDCFAGKECRIKMHDDGECEAQVNDDGWTYTGDDIETSEAVFRQAFSETLEKCNTTT